MLFGTTCRLPARVNTGEVTQVDLPAGRGSGLVHASQILSNIEGIAFANFSEIDVVRHPLVQEVIRAYARDLGQPTAPSDNGGAKTASDSPSDGSVNAS